MSPFLEIDPVGLTKFSIHPATPSLEPLSLINEQDLNQYNRDRHQEAKSDVPPMGSYCLHNAIIGPSGLVFTLGRQIVSAPDIIVSQWLRDRLEQEIASRDENNAIYAIVSGKKEVRHYEGTLVQVSKSGWGVYGHWLLDVLPSIWMYRKLQTLRPDLCSGAKIALPLGLPEWALAIAKSAVDLSDDECLYFDEKNEMIQPQMLLLPSVLRIDNGFAPCLNDFVAELVARYALPDESDTLKRIFIYRGNRDSFMPRQIENEHELLEVAERYGFIAIDPSRMNWAKQISIFSKAESVVGAFGSGMHNTLFSPSQTTSLILTNPQMNFIQSGISALRQQKMAYLWPSEHQVTNAGQTMRYDLNKFEEAISQTVPEHD